MADVPVNEKLYAMVVFQAKAKYRIYPSPGASAWVHRRYLELGGKMEDSTLKSQREHAIHSAQERMMGKRKDDDKRDPRHASKHKDKK